MADISVPQSYGKNQLDGGVGGGQLFRRGLDWECVAGGRKGGGSRKGTFPSGGSCEAAL